LVPGDARREERTIKTVLCYGDSNTWGSDSETGGRFPMEVRWPGVLRRALGEGYWVIEEGLGGRTTVRDDPIEGNHKNGRTYLRACLETHKPIDLVTIMLGALPSSTRCQGDAPARIHESPRTPRKDESRSPRPETLSLP
jgi:hypothetical protein